MPLPETSQINNDRRDMVVSIPTKQICGLLYLTAGISALNNGRPDVMAASFFPANTL